MPKELKMDDIDHKILDLLVEDTRIPFTDIAKKLYISAGTVHIRVKKMEKIGIIKGSSLILDWKKLGYTFTAYVGLLINNSSQIKYIIEKLKKIPNITVAHVTSGRFNIYLKIRAKSTTHAKNIIFSLDEIEGVYRTESMISLEESISDKQRLMHSIFTDIDKTFS
jgi:Lrp/AsnC family transcriptional regulator for asnA, asnC and gidA|tara:strand:- start:3703 stop:4200 length:498 start_codon:yes stop_codon:yes gene_type:complete